MPVCLSPRSGVDVLAIAIPCGVIVIALITAVALLLIRRYCKRRSRVYRRQRIQSGSSSSSSLESMRGLNVAYDPQADECSARRAPASPEPGLIGDLVPLVGEPTLQVHVRASDDTSNSDASSADTLCSDDSAFKDDGEKTTAAV